jgi:hypothetical protein
MRWASYQIAAVQYLAAGPIGSHLPLIDGVRACATVGEGVQTLESESGTWEPCRVAARTPARAVGVGGSDVVPDT